MVKPIYDGNIIDVDRMDFPHRSTFRDNAVQRTTSMRLGLIINPIAGMGGSVGLKGTDGERTLREALALGAEPLATSRALRALSVISTSTADIRLLVPARVMDADVAARLALAIEPVSLPTGATEGAAETRSSAMAMVKAGAYAILFAGGDGTARDIVDAIGDSVPLIGVPCGVKMYSALFATSPEAAGRLAVEFSRSEQATELVEVMDIDEEAYRAGSLTARLFGYARCPRTRTHLQGPKSRSLPTHYAATRSAAHELVKKMLPDELYLVGPGTSANAVLDVLQLNGTLLGIDALRNRKIVGRDLAASEIRSIVGTAKVHIIVGVIGGQGYVLGRGNQQIPPDVVRHAGRNGLLILSSEDKLSRLAHARLLIDTGDAELDKKFEGYVRVHTARGRYMVMPLSAGH